MKTNAALEDACEKYIQAVLRAKGRSPDEEAFWRDRRANKAYQNLGKAIGESVPADLHWWKPIWILAGSTSELIWAGTFDEGKDSQKFCEDVVAYLNALEGEDWIASLPMEFAFRNFPEFKDFGGFYLINAKGDGEGHEPPATVLERFRDILTDKLGVNFLPTDGTTESYSDLGEHFYKKSGGYIPGRPQMVIKAGRGDEFVNKHLLSTLAIHHLSLLSICQIAYEVDNTWEARIIQYPGCRLPTGEQMPPGLIEVPSVALAINLNTGRASWWPTQPQVYETMHGSGYDASKFMAIWQDIAAPLLGLPELEMSGMVGTAIRNAIWLVARCRHRAIGDLTLNSVIATETILNPFGKMGTSEGFAIFAAALTGASFEERLAVYQTAKSLYNLRNLAVHQSRPHDRKGVKEAADEGFKLFRACLKCMVKWITDTHSQGQKCDEELFKKFYQRTVLSPIG